MSAILRSPEFRDRNLTPIGDTPAKFAAFFVEDRRDGAELAKLAGARIQ